MDYGDALSGSRIKQDWEAGAFPTQTVRDNRYRFVAGVIISEPAQA